jgi:hypothetical protein
MEPEPAPDEVDELERKLLGTTPSARLPTDDAEALRKLKEMEDRHRADLEMLVKHLSDNGPARKTLDEWRSASAPTTEVDPENQREKKEKEVKKLQLDVFRDINGQDLSIMDQLKDLSRTSDAAKELEEKLKQFQLEKVVCMMKQKYILILM